MNILIVNRDLSIGGITTYIQGLCETLSADGHKVILMAGPGPMTSDVRNRCDDIVSVPLLHRFQRPWLNSYVRRHNIQVVNVHSRTQARVAHPVCQSLNVPMIITMHGPIGDRHHAALQPIYSSAAGVMVMNEHNARYCLRYGVDPSRIFLTRLMLDWKADSVRPARPARVYTYCSRLSGLKGPKAEEWLRAMAQLEDVNNLQLRLIGDGRYRGRLERLARTLGLPVCFAGSLARASNQFNDSDVLTGSGYVAIEGMRAGCAVVGLGFGGCTGAVTGDSLRPSVAMNFGDVTLRPLESSPDIVARSLRTAARMLETGEASQVAAAARLQFAQESVARPVGEFFDQVGRREEFSHLSLPYSTKGEAGKDPFCAAAPAL